MSYIVPKEIPNCCGRCPCFHAEHPMYCQAVKADKNKRIYAPYGEGRPDWCPLIEVPTPHGRLIDADKLKKKVLSWLPSDPCGQEEKEFPFETDICVSMLMEIEEAEPIIKAEGET